MTLSDGQLDSPAEFRGLKGWLVVLIVFQFLVLLHELSILAWVGTYYFEGLRTGAWGLLSIVPLGRLLIYAAFVVLVGCVIALMFARRRTFVPWFKAELAFFIILPILDIGWMIAEPWSGLPVVSLPVLLPVGLHLVLGLVWWLYIARSRRVRATFVA
jgi:hypothetical protein